jgi:hypothetical protein
MTNNELAALKAEIQQEERLYLIELTSDQKFERLMAIRLKINKLKQQIAEHDPGQSPEGFATLIN